MRDNRNLKKAYCNRGFTLVELIVVLVVLCILASVAVFSIVGYIDKARYDKNQQNAESIYQAAQAAVNRYSYNGTQEDWIKTVLFVKGHMNPFAVNNAVLGEGGVILDKCFSDTDYNNFTLEHNNAGESVHMRYVLTHTKNGTDEESTALKNLISDYFYDTSVYSATFSVEFDVEKKVGNDNAIHYYVNVYSVFFDEGRDTWDEVAKNSIDSSLVPYRDEAYREGTSLVGYYQGTEPLPIDSVVLPAASNQLAFNELTLKNDETLDLTFSVYSDDEQVTGTGKYRIHYTASVYDYNSNEKLGDLVISEASLTKGVPNVNAPVNYFSALHFDASLMSSGTIKDGEVKVVPIDGVNYEVLYTKESVVDKDGRAINRYMATIESSALVYLHRGDSEFNYNYLLMADISGESDFYRFPLKISYVINEDTAGNQFGYITYTISLDAMMSRTAVYNLEASSDKSTYSKGLSTGIARLFSDTVTLNKSLAPKNIYVAMKAETDSFISTDLESYNESAEIEPSYSEKAVRAYDDDVYEKADGSFAYNSDAAALDKASGGFAVVNSYFGDLGEGSLGSNAASGKACITSFRHLYNMRFTVDFAGDVEYTIKRDLNWYTKDGTVYTSDVKVYTIGSDTTKLVYNSPVGRNRKTSTSLTTVLWPALPKIAANQTLQAEDNDLSGFTDKTSVIRNVPMRIKSFLSTDTGYGFICENDGTVKNLRCENFSLSFDDTKDGDADDLADIKASAVYVFINGNKNKIDNGNQNKPKRYGADSIPLNSAPVACLIGSNYGTLGKSGADINKNVIKVSNSTVLVGKWNGSIWSRFEFETTDSVGGVIGNYEEDSQAYGLISMTGRYAVIGKFGVGGIIGFANEGIDAYLLADSTIDKDSALIDFGDFGSLVHGRTNVGGAIGHMNNSYLAQSAMPQQTYSCDNSTGVVTVTENTDAKYGVYVNISSDSYVWQFINSDFDKSLGTGGAIGFCENYTSGKTLSVKCINAGYILAGLNDNSGKDVSCRNIAAAIGYLKGGEASSINIKAENSGYIGTKDASSPYGKNYCAAVGIACIDSFGKDGAIYVIDASNSGKLYCDTNSKNKDAGVGVAIGASLTSSKPEYYIKAVNSGRIYAKDKINSQNGEAYWKNGTVCDYGVGGAVGYMYVLGYSHIYSLLQSGSAIEATGNNIGGAVGCIRNTAAGNSSENVLTVTAHINGVSINSSDEGINIGGCIGNMWCHGSYCNIRSYITGAVTISGYKNIGGVIGREQQEGNAIGSVIALKGSDGATTLTIRAVNKDGNTTSYTNNAGGAVGIAGSHNGDFSVDISMPTQSTGDKLVIDVKGYQNVGGMAGCFYMADLQGANQKYSVKSNPFEIALDPTSKIVATDSNSCVGGAVGLINSSTGDFESNIKVTINSGGTANVVSGTNYVGGAVGKSDAASFTGGASAYIYSPYAVVGKNYVGGSVGYINLTTSAGEFTCVLAGQQAVTGETGVGGCIGRVDGSGAVTKATAVLGGYGTTNTLSPIYANGTSGGCIGYTDGSVIVSEAVTYNHTSGYAVSMYSKFDNNIGGVVGKVTGTSVITAANLYCTPTDNAADNNSYTLNISFTSNNVGGVAGLVDSSGKIVNINASSPVNIVAKQEVGGMIGKISNTGKVENISCIGEVSVSAEYNVGGIIGTLDGATVGKEDKSSVFNFPKIIKVEASKENGIKNYGTGGMIGIINNDGKLYGSVNVTLTTGSLVSGRYNVGGVVGNVYKGYIYGGTDGIMTTFDGGRVTGTNGGVGGTVGGILGGRIEGKITSKIVAQYSLNVAAQTPVEGYTDASADKNNGKGIGGVIGQIGIEQERNAVIYVDTVLLQLDEDFALIAGNSSVGGLVGRCESTKAEIGCLKMQSIDNTKHQVIVNSRTGNDSYDIGGMIGYMYGTLDTDIVNYMTEVSVSGGYYIGGVIGCLDGSIGSVSQNVVMDLAFIKSVTGSNSKGGVGGVIGILGGFNGVGYVNSNVTVNLSDTTITSNGLSVGGFIGSVGGSKKGTITGKILVNMSNTTISGTKNVGGVIGCVTSGSTVNENASLSVNVATNCTVNATTSGGYSGGIIGTNEGVFLADVMVEIADSATYTVKAAANGYVGGIMGMNAATGTFGKTGSAEFTIPEDKIGTLDLTISSGGCMGIVLGYNKGGKCGTFTKSGDTYVALDDGSTINYISDIILSGTHDTTDGRDGFVGYNDSGTINHITVNAQPDNSGGSGSGNDPGNDPDSGNDPDPGNNPDPGNDPDSGNNPDPGNDPDSGNDPDPGNDPDSGNDPDPGNNGTGGEGNETTGTDGEGNQTTGTDGENTGNTNP